MQEPLLGSPENYMIHKPTLTDEWFSQWSGRILSTVALTPLFIDWT